MESNQQVEIYKGKSQTNRTNKEQGRNWTGTYFATEFESAIERLRLHCLYFMCQIENCPKTNREHLQFFVHFSSNQRRCKVTSILPGAHVELARNSESCIKYCSKIESRIRGPYSQGVAPGIRVKQGKKITVEDAIKLGEEELQQLSCYSYIITKKALALVPLVPTVSDKLRGEWYHGPPGCGKSRLVREKYTDIYSKGQNKWFCGYTGQSTILLDDLDVAKGSRDANEIGHMLKIVADHYACIGEFKGGQVALCHEKFVVTSNYLPEDIWYETSMIAAIRRRFVFFDMN